jgi:hypothetical protein
VKATNKAYWRRYRTAWMRKKRCGEKFVGKRGQVQILGITVRWRYLDIAKETKA